MVFVFALFFSNNKTVFKNQFQESGLVYGGNEQVGDLVNRDTDGDKVTDWLEGIYGTDPTKKDTDGDGIPDNIAIARMGGQAPQNGELNLNIANTETLTATDQLSKEIFSTIATLNQTGIVDQETIDKLSQSLANKIGESTSKKVFVLNDLSIIKTDTAQDIKNYNNALNTITQKYPLPSSSVLEVLDKFIIDEDTVDDSALLELDNVMKHTDILINEMVKINVPQSLAQLHLDMINTMQKMTENISSIKFYNTDILLAMSGIVQYGENVVVLESALDRLAAAINAKL